MVVQNRISFLRGLAHSGAKLTFVVTVNPSTGVQKVKILADPSCQIPLEQQCCTLGMLDMLTAQCNTHRVADRGHKHSSAISEVIFYITSARKYAQVVDKEGELGNQPTVATMNAVAEPCSPDPNMNIEGPAV